MASVVDYSLIRAHLKVFGALALCNQKQKLQTSEIAKYKYFACNVNYLTVFYIVT